VLIRLANQACAVARGPMKVVYGHHRNAAIAAEDPSEIPACEDVDVALVAELTRESQERRRQLYRERGYAAGA
jgi:hypothetical protein